MITFILIAALCYLSVTAVTSIGAGYMRNREVPTLVYESHGYGDGSYVKNFTKEQEKAQEFWKSIQYSSIGWPLQIVFGIGWSLWLLAKYGVKAMLNFGADKSKQVAERKFNAQLEIDRQELLDTDPTTLSKDSIRKLHAIENMLGIEPTQLALEAPKPTRVDGSDIDPYGKYNRKKEKSYA